MKIIFRCMVACSGGYFPCIEHLREIEPAYHLKIHKVITDGSIVAGNFFSPFTNITRKAEINSKDMQAHVPTLGLKSK